MRARFVTFAVLVLGSGGCAAPGTTGASIKAQSEARAVPLRNVLASPQLYHRARVRTSGYCHVEFEGTRLAPAGDVASTTEGYQAVWLQVEWPPAPEVRRLSDQYCAVEGVVNADRHGHGGMYRAAIEDISLVESTTEAREQSRLVPPPQ